MESYAADGKLARARLIDTGAVERMGDAPEGLSDAGYYLSDIGFYLAESMKVVEDKGRLIRISKDIPAGEALGASIDVYRFSPEAGEAFFRKCGEYIEQKGEKKLWSEVALNDILSEIEFRACPLDGRWYEIDHHDDLAAAERIFADD
jgi:choline kinase